MKIERYIDFANLTLGSGAHEEGKGLCAMEAAAWIAGEPHSDSPQCVSPCIASYLRCLNDRLNAEDRQLLKPLIVASLGTNDPELEQARAYMCADRAIRVFAPLALSSAGLEKEAESLRSCEPVTDKATCEAGRARAAGAARAARAAGAAWATVAARAAWAAEAAGATVAARAAWAAEAAWAAVAARAAWAAEAAWAAVAAGATVAARAAGATRQQAVSLAIECAWDLIRLSWPDARPIESCPSVETPLEAVLA